MKTPGLLRYEGAALLWRLGGPGNIRLKTVLSQVKADEPISHKKLAAFAAGAVLTSEDGQR